MPSVRESYTHHMETGLLYFQAVSNGNCSPPGRNQEDPCKQTQCLAWLKQGVRMLAGSSLPQRSCMSSQGSRGDKPRNE